MLKYVIVLLLNLPDGQQVEISQSMPLDEADCLFYQSSVWNGAGNSIVYTDEDGPVHRYDAACVPVSMLKGVKP